MPSLHIAWAVWCTVALWRISGRRWVRVLAVLYPCVTAVAVLATGNHFLLDIAGGLVAIGVSLALVRRPRAGASWPGSRARGERPLFAESVISQSRVACHKVVTKSKSG